MDYVFGTEGEIEVLKTKGEAHSDLTGYHQIERTYPDQTITDNFRIVQKLDSTEDSDGNCYDWYEIDHHYRIAERTGPLAAQATEMENILCEQDAATDERLSAMEDALCELDEAMNDQGGDTDE